MKAFRLRNALVLWLSVFILVACGSRGTPHTPPPAGHQITFTVTDNWGQALPGASLYLDGALSPTATADGSGNVTVILKGSASDVIVTQPGYRSYAYLGRDFSGFDTFPVALDKQADLLNPPGNGTIDFTVSGGTPGDFAFVQAWSVLGPVQTGIALNGSGDGSGSLPAPAGDYVLVVRPNDTSLGPVFAYYGRVEPVTVTAGNSTPVAVALAGGGKSFSVTADNGISGGNMELRFDIYGDADFLKTLSTSLRAVNNAASVSGEPITVPAIASTLPADATFDVTVDSTDRNNVAHGWTQRVEYRDFGSIDALNAALSDFTTTLPDFGISSVVPSHDAASVATRPTFTFSDTSGGVTFAEVTIDRYVLDGLGKPLGTVPEMRVRNYGGGSSVTIPEPLALSAGTYYTYNLRLRRDSDPTYRHNRVGGMCFTTGATSPSTAGVCTP